MNIYCNTNKPTEGWIHGCFNCCANTAYTRNYTYENKTHVVFLCRSCERKTKDELASQKLTNSFQIKIKNYINDRTLVPYKARVFSLDPPRINQHNTQPSEPIQIPKKNDSPPIIDDLPKTIPSNKDNTHDKKNIFNNVNTEVMSQ
tara:strand:+ start:74 stop:511 length:438 start_codon:yes stop_codon:yes gene_type:complete